MLSLGLYTDTNERRFFMDQDMNYNSDYKYIPGATSNQNGKGIEVIPDLYMYTIKIVNVVYLGDPQQNEFILVDAGMPTTADMIISTAVTRFGRNCKPKAIILTHGHFDHVGAIIALIKHWQVPVYAHPFEIPYLTGEKDYPKPDPSVDSGLFAKLSTFFPHEAINLGANIHELPADGTVPYLEGFRWIHTPGHTPGHISLFRESDGTLIAGDAFTTVKQESLFKVWLQTKEISGPPKYFTTDWTAAKESVKKLAALDPKVAITGHGAPLIGKELHDNLQKLVKDFDQIAMPNQGEFLN